MMKRLFVGLTVAATIVVTATQASADTGWPGKTFPEQPGANVAMACATVTSGIQVGGGAKQRAIGSHNGGLVEDACFGG